jgi:transcriptional regulator with XRE-family HTH domain
MGHRQGSRRAPLGELIAHERQRRGLTRVELAALVRRADRSLGTDESQIKRWENGQEPQPAALRALAAALGRPVEEFTAIVHPTTDRMRDGDLTIDTYRLASGAVDWRALVPELEQSADRLCRLYATRPPVELVPRVQQRVRLIQDLLNDGARQHRRELVETAGWLYLLLSALHGDLDQREAAWTTRDVGYRLGVDLGHGELIGWSYETASWLSLMDELWVDVLEAAEEGVRVSPPRSSAKVQNMLKVAHAEAALREPTHSERALDHAAEVVAGMDPTDRPEHHFVFDAAKFDMFAAHVYTEAGAVQKAADHARISIERSDDPSNPARYHPIRAMAARVDLASALLELGELDEACGAATAALRAPFPLPRITGRVGGLLARLRYRYPKEPKVLALSDEYRNVQAVLGAT